MAFANNSFATVWKVEAGKGNFVKVQLSTSRKNKDGKYDTDFSGIATFIGEAKKKAESLKERDRIKLLTVSVTNQYDKEKKTTYVNYNVFDFEVIEVPEKPEKPKQAEMKAANTTVDDFDSMQPLDIESDDLPF